MSKLVELSYILSVAALGSAVFLMRQTIKTMSDRIDRKRAVHIYNFSLLILIVGIGFGIYLILKS